MGAYTDTITALATPPGRGGVGIIRISGPQAMDIAKEILKRSLKPRKAEYLTFHAADDSVIDQGIALSFPSPNSFTGEDVLELHGHGGHIVLDNLLQRIIALGARLARPGEFSERAFLNGKMDLVQAEAIADLIDSSSKQAATAAINSLQGEFSKRINIALDSLIKLRMYVEAAIDFPEEEIDFLSDGNVENKLKELIFQITNIQQAAQQGKLLREGMTAVIIGRPNAGKSSLLNQLSGNETAIVTDIPGTTRDVLREYINIDGMPLHIIDTAGLRDSPDSIEQEGIRRAWQEIDKADHILLVIDGQEVLESQTIEAIPDEFSELASTKPFTMIINKIDLLQDASKINELENGTRISISAKTGEGVDLLRRHLAKSMGFNANFDGAFLARRRHLDALKRAREAVQQGLLQLQTTQSGELVAEECRIAQQALSEITGEFTSDDLLSEIFSSFCIGK